MLLYLAEFADAEGRPEDPVRVERELPQDPPADNQTSTTTKTKPKTDETPPRTERPAVDD